MNIKIGKGGSGKINSTKGGSGKTNQKKYIDLLPPNFISKVTLSGGDYSNGTYTRSSGGTTTFNGPDGKSIVWAGGGYWAALDPLAGEDTAYSSFDLINWDEQNNSGPPTGVTQNILSFLFDPIFYKSEIQNERYKILLQGCTLSYVNGVYSQTAIPGLYNNRPYYVKDDDINMIIYYDGTNWNIDDISERNGTYSNPLFYKFDACNNAFCRPHELNWSIVDGGYAYDDGQSLSSILQYDTTKYERGARLDPYFLEQIRNYQIADAIPNQGVNPRARHWIINASFNTKKAEIKNNTFSYIKYSDNSDVEEKKLNRKYMSIEETQTAYGINPPKDNKKPLLVLTRNDILPIFTTMSDSTLNMFIRLQRPIQHKNPNNGQLVREKRGIFCTSDFNYGGFSIGYRCPYYNITGRPSYRGVFNNFSFVFSFGNIGYCGFPFERPISANLMTDYKFNFGEMYMLTIIYETNVGLSIRINGEIETTAFIPFNPLVNPSNRALSPYEITLSNGTYNNGTYTGGFGANTLVGPDGKYIELLNGPLNTAYEYPGDMNSFDPAHPDFPNPIYQSANGGVSWFTEGSSSNPGTPPNGVINSKLQIKRLYKTRRDEMPLGPGFYKKNGTIYTLTDVAHNFIPGDNANYLIFGCNALRQGYPVLAKKRRRYLNNIDIGVINSYNTVLSEGQLLEIYNNFKHRYV